MNKVTPKFELCFCDEMGMEQYNKYFNTRAEAMKFINSYEFKKLLKIYSYVDRMIFDLETNNVIWEYKK